MQMCTIAKLWYDNEMCVLERFGMDNWRIQQ
jgi:hypothetical protein